MTRKEFCKRGHKMAGENIGISKRKNGKESRYCKLCNRSHVKINFSPFGELDAGDLDDKVRYLKSLLK